MVSGELACHGRTVIIRLAVGTWVVADSAAAVDTGKAASRAASGFTDPRRYPGG